LDSDWYCINDTVMGGISSSTVRKKDGQLLFSGELSTKRNGGFTSMRTMPSWFDLSTAEKIDMRVIGDGRDYYLTLREKNSRQNRVYYRQAFTTEKDKETSISLSVSDFEAYTYGRKVRGMALGDAELSTLTSVGIMLADKNDGEFSLRVLELSADGQSESDSDPQTIMAVQSLFESVIQIGVPLFNDGDAKGCADAYRKAIEIAILNNSKLGTLSRNRLLNALEEADSQDSSVEKAWTFRYAMDAVLSSSN